MRARATCLGRRSGGGLLALLLSCWSWSAPAWPDDGRHAGAAPEPVVRRLCYKATSQMWDEAQRRVVPTSPEMLGRIHRAFGFWATASGGLLEFSYAGTARASYDGKAQVPYDGCIYVVLAGDFNFHGELGFGGFNGEIPHSYKRGYVFLNATPGARASAVIIHEIGHVLGLSHGATSASVMFSGRRGEPGFPVEQDRADVRARWAAAGVYTISGTVETAHDHAVTFVFAVDRRNGHTYSARSDHQGRFSIALLRPGEYRLVAKAAEVSRDLAALDRQARIPQSASWYVADGSSTSQLQDGAMLTLSEQRRAIGDVRIRMIDRPAPFPLAEAVCVAPGSGAHTFLKPGAAATLELAQMDEQLASLESYGSEPDYALLPVRKTGPGRYEVRVQVGPRAEEGERLVIARARDGRTAVGLIGIHINVPPAPVQAAPGS